LVHVTSYPHKGTSSSDALLLSLLSSALDPRIRTTN
jgi:hypothetical protein